MVTSAGVMLQEEGAFCSTHILKLGAMMVASLHDFSRKTLPHRDVACVLPSPWRCIHECLCACFMEKFYILYFALFCWGGGRMEREKACWPFVIQRAEKKTCMHCYSVADPGTSGGDRRKLNSVGRSPSYKEARIKNPQMHLSIPVLIFSVPSFFSILPPPLLFLPSVLR